jgi:hypothetical protein
VPAFHFPISDLTTRALPDLVRGVDFGMTDLPTLTTPSRRDVATIRI